jgi:glycosyltransferase involved in cell wall biosynthesis
LDSLALRRFDRVIAVSTVVREEMAVRSIPRNRIEVVENGLDYSGLDGDTRAELRSSVNAAPGDVLVAFIGRLSPPKGLPFLVEAAGKLSAISNLHFVLIGDGPLSNQLRYQIHSRRLERSVHLIGHRDDVPALLREIDLLVLPSLREGTPVVLLEAMAAGLPVIATDVGGVSRLIEHGSTGRLVPPGDADALATEIRRWLEEPGDRIRVGARARELVRSQFTSERMAQSYDAVYCAVSAQQCSERASRAPWMFPFR